MTTISRIRDFDDPDFDPFIAEKMAFGDHPDPYKPLAELRRKADVHELDYYVMLGLPRSPQKPNDRRNFCVLGYDAVLEVLNYHDTYLNRSYDYFTRISFGETILMLDAPEHARYRRILQKAFQPGVISEWGKNLVDPVVDRLMSAFIERKECDLIEDFAHLYPFQIIFGMLDLPESDIKIFHKLAVAQTIYMSHLNEAKEAGYKLGLFFDELVRERRQNPGRDLISLLACAEADGEYLPSELIISFLRQLVNAGGDTTYRATGTMLTCLLNNPDQMQAMQGDRSLIAPAIEETVRWDAPALTISRMAGRDVVLAGVEIPKGSLMDVVLGSANRDERQFADPERFDIFREKKRNVGFGGGRHICIGQHLARLEMARAMTAILDRMPNLRLDPDRPSPKVMGTTLRSPDHIYVKFS